MNNKKSIRNVAGAFATLALLFSCSEFDPGLSDQVLDYTEGQLDTLRMYTQHFNDRYGTPDPNHTWGFGESTRETRGVLTGSNGDKWNNPTKKEDGSYDWNSSPKSSNWLLVVIEDNKRVDVVRNEYAIGTNIPNFPGTDGKYRVRFEQGENAEVYTFESTKKIAESMQSDAIYPISDVTDFEIEMVALWFRTHPNPGKEEIDTKALFIQEISQEEDRVNGSSGAFVENYGEGNIPLTYGMDYLSVRNSTTEQTEHINDFNKSGAATIDVNGNISTHGTNTGGKGNMMYWSVYDLYYKDGNIKEDKWNGNGANDFTAHISDTEGSTESYNNKWALKSISYPGSFNDIDQKLVQDIVDKYKDKEGVSLTFSGKYLGFDFNTSKNGIEYPGDGYYNNWIIKISDGPASTFTPEPEPQGEWWRVMCEDLGNTFDFDFNDLVFDAKVTGTAPNYTVTVKVQAVGGSLPIYIDKQEAHTLLGGSKISDNAYTPLNVGGASANPKEMIVPLKDCYETDVRQIIEQVPIQVFSKDGGEAAVTTITLKAGKQNFAPQKICVPVGTKWTRESQQIEWAYPNFDKWVNKEHGDYDFGKSKDWTKEGVQSNYLFNR